MEYSEMYTNNNEEIRMREKSYDVMKKNPHEFTNSSPMYNSYNNAEICANAREESENVFGNSIINESLKNKNSSNNSYGNRKVINSSSNESGNGITTMTDLKNDVPNISTLHRDNEFEERDNNNQSGSVNNNEELEKGEEREPQVKKEETEEIKNTLIHNINYNKMNILNEKSGIYESAINDINTFLPKNPTIIPNGGFPGNLIHLKKKQFLYSSNNNENNYDKRNYDFLRKIENVNCRQIESITNSVIYNDLMNNTNNIPIPVGQPFYQKTDRERLLNLHTVLNMSYIYNKYDKRNLIYCKRIRFHLKNERGNSYNHFLIVKINSLKDLMGNPYMRLELSDEKNESFFYYLELFEDDYEKIKKQQKLVIDFHLFPYKFIDLLEECLSENSEYDDMEDQRLNAVLVLESNSNKQNMENRSSEEIPLRPVRTVGTTGTIGTIDHANISRGAKSCTYFENDGCLSNYKKCTSGNENNNGQNCSIAILNLVETNQFKELTHLSLVLKKADNEHIIKYLCTILKYLKEFNGDIRKQLSEEINANTKNLLEIKKLKSNIDKLENGIKHIQDNFTNKLCTDLNVLKEKHINEMMSLKEEHTKLVKQKEETFEAHKAELKKDIEHLKNKITSLNELYETNEKKNFNLNSEINYLKNALDEKSTKYMKLIKEKENIESEKEELEKYKLSLSAEYNALKNKYEKECESNLSNNCSFENIRLSNSSLEADLKKYKERNIKLEKEINAAIDEINKGNDIITKLQNQLKKMKEKLKSKMLELSSLEKKNTQNESELEKLQANINILQTQLNEKDELEKELKKEVDSLKKKNDETVKELSISREVNLRLNKEITNRSLDQYVTNMGNLGTANIMSAGNSFPIDTDLLDKDLFNKLKATVKNSSFPTYAPDTSMNNMNLITGKIASLDINERFNKPIKFIPPSI